MATLSDLVDKPLSEMSTEEIQEMLRGIRRNRRTPSAKPAPRQKKETKVVAPSVDSMTSDEALEILKLLGEI